uniref:Uncharacterized protein n=1 Tax=Melanopsichium pennsylvanicum 4 TaxID=1398559 RepID=A0A077RC42_9BASI|nr:putative protein [Melanopsichium pennsylvanicum 4]
MQSQLTNSNSLHPTLWLNLPQSVLNTGCEPTLLIHLPAGVFYDPFTAHNPIITQGRTSKRGYNVELLTSTDDQIELEGAVGWTARRKAKAQATWFGTDQDAEVEEEQAQHEFGEEGTEEILQSLLREFSGGEQMRPGTAKIRHGVKNAAAATTQPKTAKAKAKVEIFGVEQAKDEVSTLMIRLNIDELRSADGMKSFQPH